MESNKSLKFLISAKLRNLTLYRFCNDTMYQGFWFKTLIRCLHKIAQDWVITLEYSAVNEYFFLNANFFFFVGSYSCLNVYCRGLSNNWRTTLIYVQHFEIKKTMTELVKFFFSMLNSNVNQDGKKFFCRDKSCGVSLFVSSVTEQVWLNMCYKLGYYLL